MQEKQSTADKLRSVLAQLEFSYRIRHYHDELEYFSDTTSMCPRYTVTHLPICEREDEGHVLKVTYCYSSSLPDIYCTHWSKKTVGV